MKKYDAIIIGFGKGGKTLAAEFAKRQKTVAIVERSDRMYGGTCINIGCIPTKTLVHLAKETPVKATWEEKKDYYRQAIGRKEEVTSFLRNKNYHNLADNPNVTVYTGVGSFAGPDVVEVRTETEVIELQSSQIFINTGAETIVPPIDGIKENPRVYTSTSIMELEELPERLVIVGGGYIGLEFASMYASFGSKVTVLEGYPELIEREDRDIAASVQTVLEKKGIVFHLNAKVQSVDGATVIYEDAVTHEIHHLEGDAILLATGRRPNISGLNLEVAGVKVNERGAIIVDEWLRTTNPAIRAIGDVKGGLQFTYISLDDFRIVRDNLLGEGVRNTGDRQNVPYSVFMTPPLSRVGMTEEQARASGAAVQVVTLPVAAIPRARVMNDTRGVLKAVVDSETKQILGVSLLCVDSHEMINIIKTVMDAGLPYTTLRDQIFTHPSMSESLNDLFSLIK